MTRTPVLIVDDEKNIRMTLSRALESLDLDSDTAINGEEALAKLKKKQYDLILLDLRMPGMDGMDVLRKVRETRPDIKIIIITAHGTVESATEAMKLGAVDFIQKPFTPKEIREMVSNVLDRGSNEGGYDEHVESARKSLAGGNLTAAKEHVRMAISRDSTRPEALNLLGAILERQGDWLEALKQYRSAAALDPAYRPAAENIDRIVQRHERGDNIDLGESGGSGKKGS